MANNPLPMKPRAKRALAKCPAKGLSASAAWAALQGLGGGDDNGEHDEVRKRHADEHVEPARALLASGASRALFAEGLRLGAPFGFVTHLFEAVRALPEEQVGRDGCAQHSDQQLQVGLVQLETRDDEVAEDGAPLMSDDYCHD